MHRKSTRDLVMMFLVLITCFTVIPQSKVHATEDSASLVALNQFIEEHDISVSNELKELLEYYYEQIKIETDPLQVNQYLKMAQSIEEMLIVTNKNLDITTSMIIPSICNPSIVAGATIIAYFQSMGYSLSANMLSFAFSNKSTSTIYTLSTADKNKVMTTSWYSNVKGKYPISGSSTFHDVMDLYYSINKFSYSPSSLTGYLNISDRYDYAYDTSYPTATGVAVNMMVTAQSLGCLVPYKVSTAIKVV